MHKLVMIQAHVYAMLKAHFPLLFAAGDTQGPLVVYDLVSQVVVWVSLVRWPAIQVEVL